jgi:SAM-dependent methyltransferase
MKMIAPPDQWEDGVAYERFMGRWSRLVAERFVAQLDAAEGLRWLDVGCGTGALSGTIAARAMPAVVMAVDRSAGYAADARSRIADGRARFAVCDGTALPIRSCTVDFAVSGLVLNFVPAPMTMLREMTRAVVPGGRVAVYVWDYADGMEFLRRFWDAAIANDPQAAALDEARRFPICERDAVRNAFEAAGLTRVDVSSIDVPTVFESFDAYWTPFLGGQGPAATYIAGLDPPLKDALREGLRASLRSRSDGSISLRARAWVAHGVSAIVS